MFRRRPHRRAGRTERRLGRVIIAASRKPGRRNLPFGEGKADGFGQVGRVDHFGLAPVAFQYRDRYAMGLKPLFFLGSVRRKASDPQQVLDPDQTHCRPLNASSIRSTNAFAFCPCHVPKMADQCGLPKASLVNYLNLKEPQRPGVDALVGLAAGLSVSIDWIVGLSEIQPLNAQNRHHDAQAVNAVVLMLLQEIEDRQKLYHVPIVANGKIDGRPFFEFSALAMLEYLDWVNSPTHNSEPFKSGSGQEVASISEHILRTTGRARLFSKNREPTS